MIVKGVKISELEQRTTLTGKEMIPFQDALSNGKLDMQAIIDYFGDTSGTDLQLQSLINIKQSISNSSDLSTTISSNVGDVYFCTGDKKLYLYQGNGKYQVEEPSKYKLYVMLTPIDDEKADAIFRWDPTTQSFILPSYVDDLIEVYATYTVSPIGELSNITLYHDANHSNPVKGETGKLYVNVAEDEPAYQFRWSGSMWVAVNDGGPLIIGEITGTAYDGGKGKHNRDVLDSLPDHFSTDFADLTKTASSNTITLNQSRRQESDLYAEGYTDSVELGSASQTEAGLMSAADKVNLDVTIPNRITEEVKQLNAAIDAEEAAREAADTAITEKHNQDVSDLNDTITSNKNEINLKLDEEIERATTAEANITSDYQAADNQLQININNEAETRKAEDDKLNAAINKEITDRTNADNTLQTNINNEASARQQADTALGNRIDTEISDREEAVSDLNTKLQSEITRATQAETTLQSNIDAINNARGKANGIATLDESGLVPASQLPSYVDDVIEAATYDDLPETGEAGKIYVTLDTNLTYRWSGSAYVEISESLALGETSSTAYPGDKGKALADKLAKVPSTIYSNLTGVEQFESTVAINAQYRNIVDNTDNDRQLVIQAATSTRSGVMSGPDKAKLDGLKTGSEIASDINAVQSNLETHINNKSNPHEVTMEQVGLTTNGDGSKFLSNAGDYREIIEDTAETVKTTTEIPVAGGPLAELLNDAGITSIDTETSMQDILMQLFTKEMWPTSLTFKEGTIKTTISAPTMTLSASGLVEVGSTITVSAITLSATSQSTTSRTYSGFTYGYSAANDNTKDSSSTSISVAAQSITSNNDPYSLKRTINGSAVSADTNSDYTQVTLDSTTFKAIEGTNTVKAETTGTKYHCTFAAMPVYYACSNLGKTSEDHKSAAKDAATITSTTPSNSKSLTVTGVYPYYTNKDNITTFAKLALTSSKTLDVTFVAETASNKHAFKLPAKFNVSKITLLNTLSGNYEDYDVSKFTVTTENIDVQGTSVSYKVYTRNDGTNGSSSFKITFA